MSAAVGLLARGVGLAQDKGLALYYDAMKNYLKPTLLALLISTACAFAKDESLWVSSASPFAPQSEVNLVVVTNLTTSEDGRIIHVVARSRDGSPYLYKSLDGGVTWFILRQK